MSSIPIADPVVGSAEKERALDVIDNGQLADGAEVRRFEEEFAAFCDCEFGVGTANGTTALETALRGLGIGSGDRVVTTPFSFIATANAVRHCGATPVFADIGPETYNLDPDAVESVIRDHDGDVDAILLVHLYGLPADLDRFLDLADTYDVSLVEDAAQAHGAEYDGEPAGSFGDAACFSFYPTKNMTTGEGGMIVTDREDVARRARRYVDHGRAETEDGGYRHVETGHNFRMTSIAAAIGREQLELLPAFNQSRREHARQLSETLSDVAGIHTPVEPSDRRHVFHQYTVRHGSRDSLQQALDHAGVGSKVYYPTPIHEQPAYSSVEGSFPVAERVAGEVLSVPVHPTLTQDQVSRVADAVENAVADKRGVADD